MKKLQLWDTNRRGSRLLAAVLFCLAAGYAGGTLSAADGNAVVSQSPLGSISLGWVKPESKVPELAQLPASGSGSLQLTEDTDLEAAVNVSSPIKQVRALKKDAEKPAVSSVPVAVAMTDPEEQARNERRMQAMYADECPDPHKLSSIKDMGYKVTVTPGELPQACPLPDEVYTRKVPTPIVFTWKASALCHKPLYFEDVQLERYGHTFCPLLQPAVSGARFWLTIPMLPYLMGTYPPNECIYDLGYYRPGSCAPNMLQPLPISLRGGLIEAGAVVGAAAIMP